MLSSSDARPGLAAQSGASARLRIRESLPILLAALCFYFLTLSRQFIGDGLRYFQAVTGNQVPKPAGASHAAFPLVAWAWNRLGESLHAQAFLRAAGSEFPQVLWLQCLSAVAGSLGVVLTYLILRELRVGRALAALVCLSLGLADAYWTSATDMVEPMPAVPFMLAGILTAIRTRLRGLGSITAVGAVAVGGAIYQLALSATLVLMSVAWTTRGSGMRKRAIAALAFGAAVGVLFAGLVAGLTLTTSHGDMTALRELLQPNTAAGLFGHFSIRRLLSASLGGAYAFIAPKEWSGASRLLSASGTAVIHNLLVLSLVFGLLGSIAMAPRPSKRSVESLALNCSALAWIGAIWLFAAYWSPNYFKIWLFGVIAFALWAGEALGDAWPLLTKLRRRTISVLLLGVLLVDLATGVRTRVLAENKDLSRAKTLATKLDVDDLLVSSGWDGPSVYLRTIIRPQQRMFSLTDAAVEAQDRRAVFALLSRDVEQTVSSRKRVFFLTLLAMDETKWDEFFGARLGLERRNLDPYRSAIGHSEWVPPGDEYRLDEINPTSMTH